MIVFSPETVALETARRSASQTFGGRLAGGVDDDVRLAIHRLARGEDALAGLPWRLRARPSGGSRPARARAPCAPPGSPAARRCGNCAAAARRCRPRETTPPPSREHGTVVLGEHAFEAAVLDAPIAGLAVQVEDFARWQSRLPLHLAVEFHEGNAERLRERVAERGLARPAQADERDALAPRGRLFAEFVDQPGDDLRAPMGRDRAAARRSSPLFRVCVAVDSSSGSGTSSATAIRRSSRIEMLPSPVSSCPR